MASTSAPKTALYAIAALAFVAIACSSYLLYQSVSGNFDACCGNVLETRWAKWFGVPVSAFAVAIYGAILGLSVLSVTRAKASAPLVGAVLLAAGAALWFFVILFFIERANCPYCIATHICGLSIAAILLGLWRRIPSPGAGVLAAASVALVAMVAGQLVSSGTVDFGEDGGDDKTTAPSVGSDNRTLAFSDQIKVRLGDFPMIGSEQPTHYLAELFDYTCKSCRDVYGDLKALEKAHPGVFAVIYLPAPLHRSCNNYLPANVHDHDNACEIARSALAVWNADSSQFAAYHDAMMKHPLPISTADAEAKAISLVGEEPFRKAQRSASIERAIQTSLGHYSSAIAGGNIKMPKLFIGDGLMMHGFAPSTEAFVKGMAKKFLLE